MIEKIKVFFGKVKAVVQKTIAIIKKIVKFIKDYGFGIVNFLVLLLLYGVAYLSVGIRGWIIAIGGLWILFIGGRFLYLLYSQKLFKEDETD